MISPVRAGRPHHKGYMHPEVPPFSTFSGEVRGSLDSLRSLGMTVFWLDLATHGGIDKRLAEFYHVQRRLTAGCGALGPQSIYNLHPD